jgi:cob(I)alamin adenosyltransferase
MTPSDTPQQHAQRMAEMQEEMRKRTAAAREKRGLLLVHTGNGKGKSTAALGMLLRSLSHGKRCGVMQFIKSAPDRAERVLRSPLLDWQAVGDGFTWNTQDREADIASCRRGWQVVLGWLADPEVKFILLDELNVVLAYDYLPLQEVLEALQSRAEGQHVVVTGRGAPAALIAAADLVTEMTEIKHPFKAGIQAQAGIEF